jgi:hypothetical protein
MRIPLTLLLAPAVCLAQAPAAPHISFDAMHHDFGKIPGDAKVTHRFKVTNTGKVMLNITRLNPSCGCTSTVVGKWSLAPDESTEVEVTFNPAGFRGLSRKSIQVVSDDPSTPVATLTFEAEVVREVMPSTDSVFFQDLVRTTPRKASVKLASGNDKPVKVTDAKAPGAPYLSAETRQDGNDAWVDITLDGRKIPAGKTMGADPIFIRTSNAKVPAVTVTVQWEMRASVTASPARVAWKEPAGSRLEAEVVLRQVDKKPFRVISAKTSNPLLSVEGMYSPAAASQTLTVALSDQARAGLYTERVTLALDDPDQPELEIRVSADLR